MSKKEALAAFLAKSTPSTVPDSVDGPVSFISRTKKWTVKLPRASSSDAAAGGAGSAGAAAVVASEAEAPAPIRLTAELSHTVAVEDCSGPAVVVVAGKPKTVLVDSCRDMVIEIECCVCGVEIVNCANVTIKCSQQLVPSISVDKTTDAHVMLLSDAALAAQIVWCDAKDLRLSFLQPGGASEAALPPGPEGSEASSKGTCAAVKIKTGGVAQQSCRYLVGCVLPRSVGLLQYPISPFNRLLCFMRSHRTTDSRRGCGPKTANALCRRGDGGWDCKGSQNRTI